MPCVARSSTPRSWYRPSAGPSRLPIPPPHVDDDIVLASRGAVPQQREQTAQRVHLEVASPTVISTSCDRERVQQLERRASGRRSRAQSSELAEASRVRARSLVETEESTATKSVTPASASRRTPSSTVASSPTMATSAGPVGSFAVEHRLVRREQAVDLRSPARRARARRRRRRSRRSGGRRRPAARVDPACVGGRGDRRDDVRREGGRAGHPRDGAVGDVPASFSICGPSAATRTGHGAAPARRSSVAVGATWSRLGTTPCPRGGAASGPRGTRACGGPASRTTARTCPR